MSRDQLDELLPPAPDGDHTTLYLGIRKVTGSTRVLFCRRNGEEGVLPHPGVGVPAVDNTFDWGELAGAPLLLARGLLTHALGRETADRHAAAFATDVVRRLPDEEWDFTAGQLALWCERRETTPPPPATGDLSEGGGA